MKRWTVALVRFVAEQDEALLGVCRLEGEGEDVIEKRIDLHDRMNAARELVK